MIFCQTHAANSRDGCSVVTNSRVGFIKRKAAVARLLEKRQIRAVARCHAIARQVGSRRA
jgi:RNase P protein component